MFTYVRTTEGEARVWDEEGDEKKQGKVEKEKQQAQQAQHPPRPTQAWAEKQQFQNSVR